MTIYQTIDDIPGVNFTSREMYSWTHPDGSTRITSKPPKDATDVKIVGKAYNVEYSDSEGDHRGDLSSYLQRNPEIQLEQLPEGYVDYAVFQNLSLPDWAANADVGGGQTAGEYVAINAPGSTGVFGEQKPDVSAAGTGQYGQIITLPGGQRIHPDDPNYDTYAKQMGITETGGEEAGETYTDPSEIQPEDKKWVNELYQKYFDRDATSAELLNWTKESPDSLEQFLGKESKDYGYTSKFFKEQKEQSQSEYYDLIANSGLPEDQQRLLRQFVDSYEGEDFNYDDVIKEFNKIKSEELDPYYRELATLAQDSFITQYNEMEDARARELEAQRLNEGETIRQAKSGLEKSGMTFTGKAIEELGKESALAQEGEQGSLPTQQATEGMFYEGLIPQQSRLISSGTQARYLSNLNALGRSAEEQLGTAGVNQLGMSGYTPLGNIEGSAARERQAGEAQTLSQLLAQRQEKSKLITS